jgi:hypothetical protein
VSTVVSARCAAATLLVAVVALGCGTAGPRTADSAGVTPPRSAAAAPPAICGPLQATTTGHVRASAATEVSGLVASRTRPGVLWAHNDSGDRARLLAITARGTVRADVIVTARGHYLFLAYIGDNDGVRPTIDVYRVPEPGPGATASAPAARLTLRYPDRPQDAETLLIDPGTGALVIVTKRINGRSGVYTAPQRLGAVTTLRGAGQLSLGLGGLATAGDVSADGRTVAIRTNGEVFAWRRRGGERLTTTLRRDPCVGSVSLGGEGQGESLALSRDGRRFTTVPEGADPAVRRYSADDG